MKNLRLIIGLAAGNAAGALFCFLVYILSRSPQLGGEYATPSFLLIPTGIGLVAAWVWGPLGFSVGQSALHSMTCTLVALGIAAVAFREGVICLIILSPLLYFGVLAGALLGRILFRPDRGRLRLWIGPALGLAVWVLAEPTLRQSHTSVVIDEVRIAAPPARVWPHVLAFDPIPGPPKFWLFHLGLPYPTHTTNGGNFVGAHRACCFSGGAVFKEKIVAYEPARLLTFDMVETPPDPELLGHLDAQRGQFELRDNGDGTTTLIGRTWYSLHVRPTFYFDWWTHHIFSAVHLRVMQNVKRLAEVNP